MQIVQKNAEPFFFKGGYTGCLLVHGFTGSPSEMRPLGEMLAAAGYTVSGVRLAGHGTTLKDMAGTAWPDWYRSVEIGYQELSGICSRIFIIGFSMGGILCLHAANSYPVVGLVSINAPIFLINRKSSLASLLRHVKEFTQKKPSKDSVDRFSYDKIPINGLYSLLNLIRIVRKELPNVKVPLLVMQSRQDDVVNPKSAEYIYDNCASLEKGIEWFPKSAHLLTLGVERESVAENIINFIKRHE